jgi:ammonia channel protein AmtB
MSFAHQVVDIVVAGLVAGVVTFAASAVVPGQAVNIGVLLASMYYFSRNPWGAEDGARYNDRIDALYDRYLPF